LLDPAGAREVAGIDRLSAMQFVRGDSPTKPTVLHRREAQIGSRAIIR
jgi:hypothetical protein